MKNKLIISVIAPLFALQTFDLNRQSVEISQNQAIELAENFIVENGYTDSVVKKPIKKLELLNINMATAKKNRFNTLHKKAFCFVKDEQWHIGFLSTKIYLNSLTALQKNGNLAGRAVKVSLDGIDMSMAHKEPLFSYFNKL